MVGTHSEEGDDVKGEEDAGIPEIGDYFMFSQIPK